MRITLGVFCDPDDFDAMTFLERLAGETGRASAVLTMTPGQLHLLTRWERVSRAGVSVWVRFNWGYEGRGTLPILDTPDAAEFITTFRGLFEHPWLSGVFLGNEPNNPHEWPSGMPLKPDLVGEWVARAWAMAPKSLRVGPPPVDMFNPVLGDPYAYLDVMAKTIRERGAWIEFATVQAKTQTSAPPEDQEAHRFSHPPLLGKPMSLGATAEALRVFYRHLAPSIVLIPEANPQRKTLSASFDASDRNYGWTDDPSAARRWIDSTVRILYDSLRDLPAREAFIHFYRWSRDAWAIQHRGDIQSAIFQTAKAVHDRIREPIERPSAPRPRWIGTVTASRLRLRSGPGLGFPVLTLMPRGTILMVFEVENGWARVRWEERGLEGFAYLPYLDLRPIPEAPAFGIDLSFSDVARAGTDWLDSLPHGRPAIAVQNLFTGWATPRPAFSNIETLARAGLIVAAYVVANPALPLRVYEDVARRAKDFPLRAVFVDIEPTETIPARILTEPALRAVCEKVREAFGLPTGIYTGAWVWSRLGNPKWPWLADFPLWTARYDGRFDLPARESYGPEGWRVVGKQFRGTTRTASPLVSVDLNAFDPSFFLGAR